MKYLYFEEYSGKFFKHFESKFYEYQNDKIAYKNAQFYSFTFNMK